MPADPSARSNKTAPGERFSRHHEAANRRGTTSTVSRGKALRQIAQAASIARISTASAKACEERSSSLSGCEDMANGGIEVGVIGTGMMQEPAPELIVLAIEQAFEPGALQRFRTWPAPGQIAFQQLVQFAHAAPTAPAQAAQFGVVAHAEASIQPRRAQ